MKIAPVVGNWLLAVVSVAFTLTCSEAYLRHVAPDLAGPEVDWALLSEFYVANPDGVFTWPPNRRVRYVRVHGDRIEYDVAFEVNDLGLVDDADYLDAPHVARQVAVVGDSFTAGYHGGKPWVPALRERMATQHARLYNLGIGGAGFLQFEAGLLPALFQRGLEQVKEGGAHLRTCRILLVGQSEHLFLEALGIDQSPAAGGAGGPFLPG